MRFWTESDRAPYHHVHLPIAARAVILRQTSSHVPKVPIAEVTLDCLSHPYFYFAPRPAPWSGSALSDASPRRAPT